MAELQEAIDAGDIRSQVHPEFPELRIYNYSEEVQYRNKWNKVTLACRGLILNNQTGDIVARPWEKFFNFGQRDNRIDSNAPVEVTDKMDGSLGILYRRPDGEFAIATRGSFVSEQAIHATELLNTLYKDYLLDFVAAYWVNNNTFLFEIIYPENRIVCNYGDMDDLVLLGAVNKKWGDYFGPTEAGAQIAWPGPITEVWKYDRFVDALSFPDRQGKEGVVIRSGRNIVKLKQADYVELHRIVTNLSPKTIWEMLGSGKTIADICRDIPDEFHPYVEQHGRKMIEEASRITVETNAALMHARQVVAAKKANSVDGSITRKDYALEFKKFKNPSLLFSLLDGKPIQDAIWKMVKPRGDVKNLVNDDG
jgi:RNA ligase